LAHEAAATAVASLPEAVGEILPVSSGLNSLESNAASSGHGSSSTLSQSSSTEHIISNVERGASNLNVENNVENGTTEYSVSSNENESESTENESSQQGDEHVRREDLSTKTMTKREWRARLTSVLQRERKYLTSRVTCSICGSRPAEVTFLPCSHLISCSTCASHCSVCPQCGNTVMAEARTFLM